jgi:hypothetical protein
MRGLPKVPVSPKLRVVLGLALVLALLLGVLLAFALDALDRNGQVASRTSSTHLHLPLLGHAAQASRPTAGASIRRTCTLPTIRAPPWPRPAGRFAPT